MLDLEFLSMMPLLVLWVVRKVVFIEWPCLAN